METGEITDQQQNLPANGAMPVSISGYIVETPSVKSGRARIAGTRISVADLVIMHLRLGQSLEEIAVTYDLPLAAAHAAMVYYYDHRLEIDRTIEDDRAFAEAFRQKNPSPLKEKLAALTSG